MSGLRPWEVGDHRARWDGYLVAPGSRVLRNKVAATTVERLRAAENDLLEYRLAELRERQRLVDRTFDLAHLKALHRQLFQDVYEWAGELRTVGLARGDGDDTSFMPPLELERPVSHVMARIAETDRLRNLEPSALVSEVVYLYDYLNFAHPFREGNGRTQREFFVQLLEETGRRMAWELVEMEELHSACHLARTVGDTAALFAVIGTVLSEGG